MDGKDRYQVTSDFDDLHPDEIDDEGLDLDVDLTDPDNPIVKAFKDGVEDDDDWEPPEDDDAAKSKKQKQKKKRDDDEDDDDLLDGLEDDEDDLEPLDDDEDVEDDEDDDRGDDDDSEFSEKTRKRIAREKRLRADAEARAEALEQRVARVEAGFKLREQEEEIAKAEREAEDRLKELRAKKRAAIDEGDVDAQLDIDEQMQDVKADVRAKKSELERRREQINDLNEDFEVPSNVPKPGKTWLRKHPEFHTDSRFRRAVLAADRLAAGLGLDNTTQEYYDKIESVVKVDFPEYFKARNRRGDRVSVRNRNNGERRRRKAAVGDGGTGSGQRRGSGGRQRPGRVRLTKADQQNMRIFGLDPSNPDHVKEYAAQKREK